MFRPEESDCPHRSHFNYAAFGIASRILPLQKTLSQSTDYSIVTAGEVRHTAAAEPYGVEQRLPEFNRERVRGVRGESMILNPWTPEDAALVPVQYTYELPVGNGP
jgi:hypothetical protein